MSMPTSDVCEKEPRKFNQAVTQLDNTFIGLEEALKSLTHTLAPILIPELRGTDKPAGEKDASSEFDALIESTKKRIMKLTDEVNLLRQRSSI